MNARSRWARWWVLGAVLLGTNLAGCGDAPEREATAVLIVQNRSAADAEVFVDGAPFGPVAAGANESHEGDYVGAHELFARAQNGALSWGPVTVEIEAGDSHTWVLLDEAK